MLLGFFFFFNDTATTEIYTLSLHDALPISRDTHSQDCGVSAVCAASDSEAIRSAVSGGRPCANRLANRSASRSSAAATRAIFSIGASGSRSWSVLDIRPGFESVALPSAGEARICASAARTAASRSGEISDMVPLSSDQDDADQIRLEEPVGYQAWGGAELGG